MTQITFSKSNVFTRLTAETDNYMYDIVINNATGEFVYQMNSQTVEKFHQTSATRELLLTWDIIGQDLIDFAQMPFAEIKSEMYTQAWHYLRMQLESINKGTHYRVITR